MASWTDSKFINKRRAKWFNNVVPFPCANEKRNAPLPMSNTRTKPSSPPTTANRGIMATCRIIFVAMTWGKLPMCSIVGKEYWSTPFNRLDTSSLWPSNAEYPLAIARKSSEATMLDSNCHLHAGFDLLHPLRFPWLNHMESAVRKWERKWKRGTERPTFGAFRDRLTPDWHRHRKSALFAPDTPKQQEIWLGALRSLIRFVSKLF